ncbi:MAG: arsenate reductase (glutaredoxin) [Cognatishimia sp.]|uniref:arsenate reductase (glutaredoxin) n=1 Tax=Cognatishimia sp. TaxID=2211648 RepID=UPI003B8D1175
MTEIWHNPRCSKSRQTLALVEEKGPVTIRKYLEDAPTEAEIRAVLKMLNIPAIDLMRKGEAEFKERGLSNDTDEDALIAAMVEVPKLIERPVVIAGGQARLGRPPESVLEIL